MFCLLVFHHVSSFHCSSSPQIALSVIGSSVGSLLLGKWFTTQPVRKRRWLTLYSTPLICLLVAFRHLWHVYYSPCVFVLSCFLSARLLMGFFSNFSYFSHSPHLSPTPPSLFFLIHQCHPAVCISSVISTAGLQYSILEVQERRRRCGWALQRIREKRATEKKADKWNKRERNTRALIGKTHHLRYYCENTAGGRVVFHCFLTEYFDWVLLGILGVYCEQIKPSKYTESTKQNFFKQIWEIKEYIRIYDLYLYLFGFSVYPQTATSSLWWQNCV